VSVFAAGCAICGADLERHRRERVDRRVDLPHVPRALIMAAVGAQDRHRTGRMGERNLFISLAVVNLSLAFLPQLRFGLTSLLS
jgi:hypothetical protein